MKEQNTFGENSNIPIENAYSIDIVLKLSADDQITSRNDSQKILKVY